MKKYMLVCVVFTSVILFSASLYSQPVPKRLIQMNESQITDNLLIGTNSRNKGLCASSIYMLGDLCCKKGVIKLMSLLHNAESEEIRILSALSLCKIGDARGIFAVKQASTYDESERVKRLCGIFYKAFKSGKIYLPQPNFKS